jgi:hypothetical protein
VVILVHKKVHQKTIQRIKIMKAKIILGISLLSLVTALNSLAQATAYANIFATVVAPVGINTTFEEHSGEIVVSQTIGNSRENHITASGTALNFDGSASLTTFSITDAKNSTFDITLPSENLNFGSDNQTTLSINNFSSIQSQTTTQQGTKNVITIGAKVNMPLNQYFSSYQAQNQFPVTLNYN